MARDGVAGQLPRNRQGCLRSYTPDLLLATEGEGEKLRPPPSGEPEGGVIFADAKWNLRRDMKRKNGTPSALWLKGQREERGSLPLSRRNLRDIVIALSLVSVWFFPVSRVVTCVAIVFLVLGCFIHVVSKGTLIRNVVLCTEGVYGVVRHPYYFGNYLIDWSFCMLSGNPLAVIVYPLLFFWAYGPTMHEEERVLRARHGREFLENSLRTPRVFPSLKSVRGVRIIFDGFSTGRITPKECSRIMRFCATGLLLILVQKIRTDLATGFHYSLFPDHSRMLLGAIFVVVLYAAGMLVLRRSPGRTKPFQRYRGAGG